MCIRDRKQHDGVPGLLGGHAAQQRAGETKRFSCRRRDADLLLVGLCIEDGALESAKVEVDVFISWAMNASNSGFVASSRSSRSVTGSLTAAPKSFFHSRFAMAAANRGLFGEVIQSANCFRRRRESEPATGIFFSSSQAINRGMTLTPGFASSYA